MTREELTPAAWRAFCFGASPARRSALRVARIIVVDAWPRELTVASVTAIAAVTAVICSRFLLIGAAMRPLLSRLSPAQVYPFLHFLVEPPWLLSIRYQREGGNDPGFVIGSAATCYVTWVAS